MSLDVFVACASAALLPAHLPTEVKWQADRTGSYSTANLNEDWVIEVWLLKDPEQLAGLELPPGTKSVVGISIQGSSKGDEVGQKVVDSISARCRGAML